MYYLRGKVLFFSHITGKTILSSYNFLFINAYIMPPRKESTTTKAAATKKPATRTRTTKADQVQENARHIAENAREIKGNSSMLHALYGIIIVLMIIIAGLAFYVGTMMGGGNNTPNTGPVAGPIDSAPIEITIIDDARCSDCQTSAIADQLKLLPFLSQATFVQKDFSEKGVSDFMKDNGLKSIPAVVFNTNALYDGGQIVPYLTALPDGQFNLALPEAFDPFATRSENGFLVLDTEVFENIKQGGYIDGNPEAQITWIEYSDVQCPFCAKLHNEGTTDKISEKYGDDVNMVFQHFPLDFHNAAQKWAEGLECIAEQNQDVLYPIIAAAFKKFPNQDITVAGLVEIATENGINADTLNSCIDSGKYEDKVKGQMKTGQEMFGVTGTPGNVIVNNATGEYQVVSGAYPAEAFEAIIDKMLQQ